MTRSQFASVAVWAVALDISLGWLVYRISELA